MESMSEYAVRVTLKMSNEMFMGQSIDGTAVVELVKYPLVLSRFCLSKILKTSQPNPCIIGDDFTQDS